MVGFGKAVTPPKSTQVDGSIAYRNFSVPPGTSEIFTFKVGYPQNKSKILEGSFTLEGRNTCKNGRN